MEIFCHCGEPLTFFKFLPHGKLRDMHCVNGHVTRAATVSAEISFDNGPHGSVKTSGAYVLQISPSAK